MTTRDCTETTADLENNLYTYPVISSSKPLYIAEDSDDGYNKSADTPPLIEDTLQWDVKIAELKALRTTASGQVGRLYKLASLLIQNEPIDKTAEELKQLGLDIRNAASILEDTVHTIVGPLVDNPSENEEEFDY